MKLPSWFLGRIRQLTIVVALYPPILIGEILKAHSNFQPSLPGPADQGVRPPSRLAVRPWRTWTAHGFFLGRSGTLKWMFIMFIWLVVYGL